MENLSEEDFEQRDNSSNATATASATSVREYRAAVLLWTVWPPCVIVLGSWGNIATIFVMRRIKDHNSSQYAVLMALAMSDFVFLNSGVSREWIRHVFHVEIRELHTWVCKLHKWSLYGVSTSSAWLVTCVTVQRTMAVLWPHRMRMVWTVRRTWIVITTLVLIAFVIHSHLLYGLEITQENRCDSRPGVYEYFYRQIFMWMDTCISNLLPCLSLFVCDIILSMTLFRATSISSATIHTLSSAKHSQKNDGGRRKTASRTTVMVLALSFTFLVLTMPVYVFYAVWYQDVDAFILQTPEVLASLKLVSTLTHLLWYSNSAVNFFLYCLTGSKYRQEFVHWMLCRPPSSSSSFSSSIASVACVGGGGGLASVGKDKQQQSAWAA